MGNQTPKTKQIARKFLWEFEHGGGRNDGRTDILRPLRDEEKNLGVVSLEHFYAEWLVAWWGHPIDGGQDKVKVMLLIRWYDYGNNPEVQKIVNKRLVELKDYFDNIHWDTTTGRIYFSFLLSECYDHYKLIVDRCYLIMRKFGIKFPTDYRLPIVEECSFLEVGARGETVEMVEYVKSYAHSRNSY